MTITEPYAPPAPPVPAAPPPVGRRARPALWCAVTLTAAGAAGAALLVAADRDAEWGRGSAFGLFWLGMLIFTLPAAWWAVPRG